MIKVKVERMLIMGPFDGWKPELPKYQSELASGIDLQAGESTIIPKGHLKMVRTGIKVEIPPGYEGQIRPRSGLARQMGITILNSPGTIDADYRGEIMVLLANLAGSGNVVINQGNRIAQLVITPVVRVEIVEGKVSETGRGEGGFGSTGV